MDLCQNVLDFSVLWDTLSSKNKRMNKSEYVKIGKMQGDQLELITKTIYGCSDAVYSQRSWENRGKYTCNLFLGTIYCGNVPITRNTNHRPPTSPYYVWTTQCQYAGISVCWFIKTHPFLLDIDRMCCRMRD